MVVNLRKSLFILPNLFTLANLICGCLAIMLCVPEAGNDAFYRAATLIVLAMFFDTIDGRVARLTRTQSAIGLQLDSLSDLVSFGVAPGVMAFRWYLNPLGMIGLIGMFCFIAAGAVRLARFNVLTTQDDGTPKKPGKYVLGLPIPAAAGVSVSVAVAYSIIEFSIAHFETWFLVLMVVLSFCMISTVRFRSLKDIQLSWMSISLIGITISFFVWLSLRFHISFALSWLLLSYVIIGILETVMHWVRDRRTQ